MKLPLIHVGLSTPLWLVAHQCQSLSRQWQQRYTACRRLVCATRHCWPCSELLQRELHPASWQDIDVVEVLLAVHEFFQQLGIDEIRQRGNTDDKPLRMVKTLLHELCKRRVRQH